MRSGQNSGACCSAALAFAIERMLETDFYFNQLYCMWQLDDVFEHFSPFLFERVPGLIRGFVTRSARKDTLGQLEAQVRSALPPVAERR